MRIPWIRSRGFIHQLQFFLFSFFFLEGVLPFAIVTSWLRCFWAGRNGRLHTTLRSTFLRPPTGNWTWLLLRTHLTRQRSFGIVSFPLMFSLDVALRQLPSSCWLQSSISGLRFVVFRMQQTQLFYDLSIIPFLLFSACGHPSCLAVIFLYCLAQFLAAKEFFFLLLFKLNDSGGIECYFHDSLSLCRVVSAPLR